MNVRIIYSKILALLIAFLGVLGVLLTMIIFSSEKREITAYEYISIILFFGSVYGVFLLISWKLFNSSRKKEMKYFSVLTDLKENCLEDIDNASFIELYEYFIRIRKKIILNDIEYIFKILCREMVKRKLTCNEENSLSYIFTYFGYSTNINAVVKANNCIIYIERIMPLYKSYTVAMGNIVKYKVKHIFGYGIVCTSSAIMAHFGGRFRYT